MPDRTTEQLAVLHEVFCAGSAVTLVVLSLVFRPALVAMELEVVGLLAWVAALALAIVAVIIHQARSGGCHD